MAGQRESEESRVQLTSMGFLDHLEELRHRLLKSVVAVVVMAFVAFAFKERLMEFVVLPFGDQKLHNMEVTGAFYAYLKVSLISGVVASLPIVFYQMWAFVSPGLYRRERLLFVPLVAFSTLLFVLGAGFCYLVVLPLALEFLTGFSGELLTNYITIGSYISFAGLLLLAFGFGFQMPIVAYFLARANLITAAFLAKGRRYAIIAILVAGAIITPPDVFTQVLLAIPLYILYEISIIVVRTVQAKTEQH
ncbi:MAG: twin-arginine translocase subunit TatC [Candidatus Zixiibacteriota bacterium]